MTNVIVSDFSSSIFSWLYLAGINRHLRLAQVACITGVTFSRFSGERMEARNEPEERQTRSTPILHVFPIARVQL